MVDQHQLVPVECQCNDFIEKSLSCLDADEVKAALNPLGIMTTIVDCLIAPLPIDVPHLPPLELGRGRRGWSAPFTRAGCESALLERGKYQCACNIWWLKILCTHGAPINWRGVLVSQKHFWPNGDAHDFPLTLHATWSGKTADSLSRMCNSSSTGFPTQGSFDFAGGFELLWGCLVGCYVGVCLKKRAPGPWIDVLRAVQIMFCLLYTSPSPRAYAGSRMPSSG